MAFSPSLTNAVAQLWLRGTLTETREVMLATEYRLARLTISRLGARLGPRLGGQLAWRLLGSLLARSSSDSPPDGVWSSWSMSP